LDLVLTIVFYLGALLAVAGALVAALARRGPARLAGMLGLAVGGAVALAGLGAGFAAVTALVCLGGSALVIGGAGASLPAAGGGDQAAQLNLGAAVLLFAALAVVAVGGAAAGSFATGGGAAGFEATAVGRLLFGRDALASEAAGAALLVALAAGAAAWRQRP